MNAATPERENQTVRTLTPTQSTDRIDSIDVLRGWAVLGILTINIWVFGYPFEVMINPLLVGELSGLDAFAFFTAWIGLEGSQRAIFSMLFGASIVLFTDRLMNSDRASRATSIYYRRTCLLIVFGLIDAYFLLWYGDILFIYGVAGLLLFFARNWSPRKLFIVAVVILGVHSVLNIGLSKFVDFAVQIVEDESGTSSIYLPEEDALELLAEMPSHISVEDIEEDIATRQSGYFSAFVPNAAWSFEMHAPNALLFLLWDVLALMLLGMALYRWKILDASRSIGFYVAMTLLGFGIGIPINTWEILDSIEKGYKMTLIYGTYDLGRLAMGLGFVGMIMLICKLQIWSMFRSALAAVGRMALTNYLVHSVICGVIFIGFGFFGKIPFSQLYLIVLVIWIAQLVYSPIWLARYRYGPCEWVWRKLTYAHRSSGPLPIRV